MYDQAKEDAKREAEIASSIKAQRIVAELKTSGKHWTLTAKPK
jgi:hypothetical protein